MKRFLVILMCLFLLIGTAPAQRRDKPTRQSRPNTTVVKKPKPPKYIPYDVMPYKMRKYLNKYYCGHSIVRYILKSNPGYIDGHDCYYEVYLTNGVILLFSTKYKIIH